jgi:hypothetical protein
MEKVREGEMRNGELRGEKKEEWREKNEIG